MIKAFITFIVSSAFVVSCANEADFGGETSSVASNDAAPVVSQTAGGEECSGDSVKIAWSNPEIQKCIDAGKIWHFPNKYDSKAYCSSVKSSSSYTCDKAGYVDYSESKGISTKILVDKLEEGSKLVACGENNEGAAETWAMAQFVTSKGDGCNVSPSPITACFVNGSTGCSSGDYDCIVQWCFDKAK